jgi:hypothetical protein
MNLEREDGQKADFFAELTSLVDGRFSIEEFMLRAGDLASRPEYRSLFKVPPDHVARAYQIAYQTSGTLSNKVQAGFNSLLKKPTPRKDITDYLARFPEVFGDVEEYLKYLFQTGEVVSREASSGYEVFSSA